MRVKNTKVYYKKTRVLTKDNEGNKVTSYSDAQEIKANIYPASGKVQAEMYGDRLNYILNMLYDGKLALKEKDGICVYVSADSAPDYEIISIKPYSKHYLIELEKVIK